MRKSIYRIAAYGTAFVLTFGGSAVSAQASTSSLIDVLPSAGITYTLGSNSTSLSQVQQSSESKTSTTASSKSSSEVKSDARTADDKNSGEKAAADKTSEEKSADAKASTGDTSAKSGSAVLGESRGQTVAEAMESVTLVPLSIKSEDTETTEDAASITAISDASDQTEDTSEVKTASNKVIEDTIIISRGYTDDLKAASGAGAASDEEDEGFENLVIAQVTNYVNVRDLPSEEGEIVGKLYNNSVGNYIEEEDGWYKISSGSVEGYVKGEFCVTGEAAVDLAKQVGTRIATVNTTTLYVREDATTDSAVIGMVPIEDELIVMEELDGWVKVNVEEGDGYVSTDYVTLSTEFVKAESKAEEEARLAKEEAERKAAQAAAASRKSSSSSSSSGAYVDTGVYAPAGSASGQNVVNFALQFVGNPYVYGGSSLTNGTDCSGFVMSVYKNFGVSLPHSSAADRSVGSTVGSLAEAQPGDIICYSGHVGIYAGNGQIVHASTSKTGIIVSSASYRTILSIRRIF